MQQQTKLQNIPVALTEAQTVNNHYFVCHQERQCLQLALGSIPRVESPAHSWQVDNIEPLSINPGELIWVVTECDTYCGFGFAYLVTEANDFNTIKTGGKHYIV